jgi:hypothetical protein
MPTRRRCSVGDRDSPNPHRPCQSQAGPRGGVRHSRCGRPRRCTPGFDRIRSRVRARRPGGGRDGKPPPDRNGRRHRRASCSPSRSCSTPLNAIYLAPNAVYSDWHGEGIGSSLGPVSRSPVRKGIVSFHSRRRRNIPPVRVRSRRPSQHRELTRSPRFGFPGM